MRSVVKGVLVFLVVFVVVGWLMLSGLRDSEADGRREAHDRCVELAGPTFCD